MHARYDGAVIAIFIRFKRLQLGYVLLAAFHTLSPQSK